MPRPTKKSKPYIVVFCEGESEQVYTDFLRKEFKDVASIKRPSSTGLFEEADSKFQKDKAYQGYAEVTDEIWFFFDVETKDIGSWDARMKIIKRLRSLRKRPGIKVRLLMTTGCMVTEHNLNTIRVRFPGATKTFILDAKFPQRPTFENDADVVAAYTEYTSISGKIEKLEKQLKQLGG